MAAADRSTLAQGTGGGCQNINQTGFCSCKTCIPAIHGGWRALSFCMAPDQRVGLFESRARAASEVETRTAGRQVKGCDPGEI